MSDEIDWEEELAAAEEAFLVAERIRNRAEVDLEAARDRRNEARKRATR